MKKHIQIIAGILLLLASSTLFAQNDSQAAKLYAQSLRNRKSIEATFTYQTVGDATINEEPKQGKAYFQNDAYKIIMEDQHAISNGTTTWHYIIEDEEVVVGDAEEDNSPYKILDKLEKDLSGITTVFDAKGNLKSLEVEIDQGIKLLITISKMEFDKEFPKDFFSFKEKDYPNVEIIDMR